MIKNKHINSALCAFKDCIMGIRDKVNNQVRNRVINQVFNQVMYQVRGQVKY